MRPLSRSIRSQLIAFAFLAALTTCEESPAPDLGAVPVTAPPVAAVTAQAAGITHTRLTSGNNPVNQKVYATASIAPAPNALITVAVLSNRSTGAISPALTGGGMSTWTQVASVDFDVISLPHGRLTVFRAMSSAPGTGPITITFSSSVSNVQWIVSQWTGVDQSGVNGAGAIGQTGSNRSDAGNGLAVVLAAMGNAANVSYGVFGVKKNVAAVTPGAGFTEIDEQPSSEGTASDLEAEWAINDNTIDATWTALNGGALGVEIKAGNPGPSVSPALSTLEAVPTSIPAGSGTSTITVTVKDASGNPIGGATVSLAATPVTGNTLTQPTTPTDANGVATGTLGSTVAEPKTVTATANGIAVTQAATVTVTSFVAVVEVSPSTAGVEVGRTLQLTATPKDAAGNPVPGGVVTWATSDWSKAAVNEAGVVTGLGVAVATITATSEGRSGSATITVVTPTPCLARAGPLVTLSGVQTSAYFNIALADNTKIAAATAQFLTPANRAIAVGGGSGICFSGGETLGQLPPATDWLTMHDTYGFQSRGIAAFTLEGTRQFDYGDGITLDDNTTHWIIRGVYFKYTRDDCVQNDWLNSGLLEDSFFDGCYEGFSSRPFLPTQEDGSANLVVVQNSLFRLQDMDQGYDGPGHGGFFKWSPTSPMVSLYNNVYRVDSRSTLGTHTLGPPAGKVRDCANNVMIWLGSGPFPETLPSCYTLLTGSAGLQYWHTAVASWKARHPTTLNDVAPPIVSLYSPSGPTRLEGTVSLTATAVDDREVVGVQFRLDGQDIGSEVTAESPVTKFTLSWNADSWPHGTHTLTATARDAAGNTKTSVGITVTIGSVSPGVSTVSASPTTITASGGSVVASITVTARDANGSPISGASVSLSATGSNLITQPVPTDANGVTTGTLSSVAAGLKTVTATADGVILTQTPTVTVTAGAPDADHSTVTASPATIAVGAPSTITTTVKDAFNNPISGSNVVLAASGTGNTLTQPAAPTDASGAAVGALSSTVAEAKIVTATAGGMSITQTATVLVAPPGPAATITHALLTAGSNAVNLNTYTTATIAPAANRLITVAVLNHRTPAANSPTLSGGGMASWNVVATVDFDTIGGALRRLTIFRAMSASPGSGPITITFVGSVSNVQWIVSQWDGVETSGVNGAGAIGQTGSDRTNASNGLTVTLGAFGNANNVAYGVFGVNKNVVAITPGAGFTKIHEQPSGENTPGDLLAEWAVNDNTIDAIWANLKGGALGVEIKAKAGP
jgi:adhesin/invasin